MPRLSLAKLVVAFLTRDARTISLDLLAHAQVDSETRLHYNRYGYYDPGLGRYLTQEPIGAKRGRPELPSLDSTGKVHGRVLEGM
jgi:hypothetical protein